MRKDAIAIKADPNDPDDFDVTYESLELGYRSRDVRLARFELSETQEEFAERFAVTAKTIYDWENSRDHAPDPVVEFARSVLSHSRSMRTTDAGTVKESAERTVDRAVAAS